MPPALACFAAVFALAAGVAQAAPEPQGHVLNHARDAFSADVPSGCHETASDETLDFQVFVVMCADVPYAGVYAGNAPDLTTPRSRVMTTGLEWPSHIQAWSLVVPGDQSKADRIAASVRPRGTQ